MNTKNTETGLIDDLKEQLKSSILTEFPNIEADLDPDKVDIVEEGVDGVTEGDDIVPEKKDDIVPEKKEDDIVPEKKEDDVEKQLDDRVEALIKAETPGGSHASAKTVASWKEVTTALAELKTEKLEHVKKVAELEAEVKKAKESVEVPENLKQELEYLRNKLAEVDYAALPEIKATYDKPLEQATDAIISLFQKAQDEKRPRTEGLADRIRATIKETGIFGLDWDGLLDACATSKVLTVQERKAIETTLGSALALQQRKESAMKEAGTILKEKSEATKVKETADKEKWDTERKEYLAGLDKAIKDMRGKNPNLNPPPEPGPKATDEEKAEYKKELENYTADEQVFFKYANTFLRGKGIGLENSDAIGFITPAEFVTIFEGFVNAKVNAKTIAALNVKVAELTEKLDNYKKGGSTLPSKTTPSSGGATAKTPVYKTAADARDAMRAEMEKLRTEE